MSDDCLFCKIIAGKMGAKFVYQDELAVAFNDIHLMAPVHVLVAPIEHITALSDVDSKHEVTAGHLLRVCNEVAKLNGIADRGYRVVINCGPDGGQIVQHLHLHVLGGRKMQDNWG